MEVTAIRLFIAIDLSDEQKRALQLLQQRAQKYLAGVKWTAPKGIHLTLKFLGEVEVNRLPAIKTALTETASITTPFSFGPGGVGVFPAPRRARVIWAGLIAGKQELVATAAHLERSLARGAGFLPERRPFTPHLTIGRIRQPVGEELMKKFLDLEADFQVGPETAAQMVLYESRLGRHGATYNALEKIQFNAVAGK